MGMGIDVGVYRTWQMHKFYATDKMCKDIEGITGTAGYSRAAFKKTCKIWTM